MPVYTPAPPDAKQSNLLSSVINAGGLWMAEIRRYFTVGGYHLMSDNVDWEQLYPTVKTGGAQLLARGMIISVEELLICQINVTSLNKVFIKGLKFRPQC